MALTRKSRLHDYRQHIESKKDFEGAKETFSNICRHLGNMEDSLAAAIPGAFGGFVDSPISGAPTQAPVPQSCTFSVRVINGLADIEIVLPQFAKAPTPQAQALMVVSNPNALLAGIVHNIQSCGDNTFTLAGGVKDYQPTAQTHILKIDGNLFWRIRSSFDGKNFNKFSAAVQAATS
jgi:hypothetical protein